MHRVVKIKALVLSFILLTALIVGKSSYAEDKENDLKPFFVFSPMVGWVKNKVIFTNPGTGNAQAFIDESPIYGFDLVYISPKIVLGATGHRSDSAEVNERGLLWHGNYFFDQCRGVQPTIGISIENITLYSKLSSADVPGLVSMDAFNDILSTHVTAGVVIDNVLPNRISKIKLTPFAGYFNERVRAIISSPGIKVAGQNRFGFETEGRTILDYLSLGAKIEVSLAHFINIDSKVYYRLKKNEKTYYTLRNRIDLFFNRQVGLSIKVDYFKDKYETNLFIMAGPALVF